MMSDVDSLGIRTGEDPLSIVISLSTEGTILRFAKVASKDEWRYELENR